MSKDKTVIYEDISDFLRWNRFDDALTLLRQNPDLDTTYNKGEFILRAISANHLGLVKYLVEHYNALHTQDVQDYQKALHKMQTIIEEATSSSDISTEIESVISSYIRKDDSDDEQCLIGCFEEDTTC